MRFALAFLLTALLCACSQGQGAKLPTARISVDSASGPVDFTVEMATDDSARRRGLMERTELAPDAGMLFDYHTPQYVGFWMKNTPLSLDLLFIRADGTIAAIVDNTTPYSETHIPSVEPVRAVLEINAGRARELGIQPGHIVHAAIFGNLP